MWNRMFGADSFRAKGSSYIRSTLHQVLDQTECSQLVIGHSVQVWLSGSCQVGVWGRPGA